MIFQTFLKQARKLTGQAHRIPLGAFLMMRFSSPAVAGIKSNHDVSVGGLQMGIILLLNSLCRCESCQFVGEVL